MTSRILKRITVWHEDSDKFECPTKARATPCSNGDMWRIQIPLSAISHWPDNIKNWDLLMTDMDDKHAGGIIKRDDEHGSDRILNIPRDGCNTPSIVALP